MRLLVTGGAGYVGSVVVRRLRDAGHSVLIVDDFRTGHREAVGDSDLVEGDFGDGDLIAIQMARQKTDAVVHMAASCLVGESVRDPAAYHRNNVTRSLALLEAMGKSGVQRLIFSSSAAVYGDPASVPITEDHPTRPTNPYGETKLAFERALAAAAADGKVAAVSLRYFNAAGASRDALLGEDHKPESHLIPIVLRAAIEGTPVPVLGTDYDTRDGTAVRDYVHVEDLADAHVRALARMSEPGSAAFNLGNGAGFSVREVVETARTVCDRPIATIEAGRRPGDPATLIASSDRARRDLGWQPEFPDLAAIVETAWRFMRDRPRGYAT